MSDIDIWYSKTKKKDEKKDDDDYENTAGSDTKDRVEVYNNDEVGLNELHDEAIEFCMKVTQPIELHESYKHYEYGE